MALSLNRRLYLGELAIKHNLSVDGRALDRLDDLITEDRKALGDENLKAFMIEPKWLKPTVQVRPGTTVYDWVSDGTIWPDQAIVRYKGVLYQQNKGVSRHFSWACPPNHPDRWHIYQTTPVAPPAWKSSALYGEGDRVLFDGKVYRQKFGWPQGGLMEQVCKVKSLVVPSEAVNRWEVLTG